jgi:hypothetical protein
MQDNTGEHATSATGRRVFGTLALVGVPVTGGLGLLLLARGDSLSAEPLLQMAGAFLFLLALAGVVVHRARWAAGGRVIASRWPARWRPPWAGWLLGRLAWLGSVVALAFWFSDIAYSHDHAEHCFKAFHFWHEMLGRGRLKGWSHFLAFGYPAGELTPFGPELWVALFRAATLGLLSWTHTYALAFASVVVFAVAAVYRFGKRFFGRRVAIIAAVIWMLDPGGWYQGGWFWLEWLGVWPVTLAMSFTLLALINMADLLASQPARPHRRILLGTALWMLASLVTHQLPIVVYVIAVPCLLLAEWWRNPELSRAAARRLAAAVCLGLGLGAFYLVPMFARNELTQDLGVRGFSLVDLAHRLVDMHVFENGWSLIAVLAVLGAVLAVRSGAAADLFFVLCACVFVLLSSDILLSVFHAERVLESIVKLECQRMLLVAKLFAFPLAGHALVRLFRGGASAPALGSPARRLAAAVVLAALGAPLATPAALHIYQTQVRKEIEHRGDEALTRDLHDFFAWSLGERRASDEPYRIAYSLRETHDHIVSIAPVFNRSLLYKVGYTSAQQFRAFPMSDEPALLEALAVKYLVADHDRTDPAFVPERTFGQLRVYRLSRYRARQPFTVLGEGKAELVELAPERIHLRLQGTSPATRLTLHVAGFPRWEARQGGRVLPIEPATVYGLEYPILMQVPAGDGDLVFRYVRRAPDWLGLAVTLVSLLVFGGLAAAGYDQRLRRQAWFLAASAVAAKRGRVLLWAASVLVVAAGAMAVWRAFVPVPRGSEHLLDRLAPTDEVSLAGARCENRGVAQWRCGGQRLGLDVVGGAYGSHVCLTAPAPGPLVISTRQPLGRFLQASYDAAVDQAGRIRIAVDDELLGDTPTRGNQHGLVFLQVDTRSRAGQPARLRLELEGAPLRCFDVRILR